MTEVLETLAEGRRSLEEGREAIALEHFVVAADAATDPALRDEAVARCAEINLSLGRPYEAMAWTERLRREAPRRDHADLLEAVAHLRVGAPEQALELLEGADGPVEGYRPSAPAVVRAQVLAALDRPEDALGALADAMRADPTDPAAWTSLAALCEQGSGAGTTDPIDPTPVVALAAGQSFADTLGHLVHAPSAGAERVLDALWLAAPGDPRALVLVGYLGSRMTVERALEWSGRLRVHGRGADCPLLGLAASTERTPLDRVRAAAVAAATFADERAGALLDLGAAAVQDRDLPTALSDVGTFAPDLAGDFLVAAATTPSRALVLARVLLEGGVDETAVALARHAVELTAGSVPALTGAVAQTLSLDAVEALAAAAAGEDADIAAALRAAA